MQTIEKENQNLLRAGYPPLADCEPLHTPGPWNYGQIKENPIFDIIGPNVTGRGNEVVGTFRASQSRVANLANAHLIAAAPDMFDALRAIVDAYGDRDSLLIDQAKAALAKATA